VAGPWTARRSRMRIRDIPQQQVDPGSEQRLLVEGDVGAAPASSGVENNTRWRIEWPFMVC
jgi:hypothetical protein